jgi:hypothetical protein
LNGRSPLLLLQGGDRHGETFFAVACGDAFLMLVMPGGAVLMATPWRAPSSTSHCLTAKKKVRHASASIQLSHSGKLSIHVHLLAAR